MYNPFQQNMYNLMNNIRQPMYQAPQFITKQVTSIEEARASMIDPLSTYLFVDTSTGRIYMKRMNNNGLSDFFVFNAEETSKQSNPLDEINQRLTNIESRLGGNNVQSVSTESESNVDESAEKSESSDVRQGSTNDKWKNRNSN